MCPESKVKGSVEHWTCRVAVQETRQCEAQHPCTAPCPVLPQLRARCTSVLPEHFHMLWKTCSITRWWWVPEQSWAWKLGVQILALLINSTLTGNSGTELYKSCLLLLLPEHTILWGQSHTYRINLVNLSYTELICKYHTLYMYI